MDWPRDDLASRSSRSWCSSQARPPKKTSDLIKHKTTRLRPIRSWITTQTKICMKDVQLRARMRWWFLRYSVWKWTCQKTKTQPSTVWTKLDKKRFRKDEATVVLEFTRTIIRLSTMGRKAICCHLRDLPTTSIRLQLTALRTATQWISALVNQPTQPRDFWQMGRLPDGACAVNSSPMGTSLSEPKACCELKRSRQMVVAITSNQARHLFKAHLRSIERTPKNLNTSTSA